MKDRFISIRPLDTDLAALLLRLLFGGLMMYHGYQKIENYDSILPMFTDLLGIGSKLSFNLLIFAEFFCGMLVMLGIVTRLAVLPILFSMAVAYFMAHEKDSFQVKELAFILMLLGIPVLVLGSGTYSVDRLFQKNKPS